MIRGFYQSVSGMVAMARRMEVATTNLANVQTNGYKQERTSMGAFAEQLISRLSKDDSALDIGNVGLSGASEARERDWSQGGFQTTGRDLDLALNGSGFFALQTPEGVRYTRNGAFVRDSDGILTSSSGRPVLGENGPIVVGSGQITVMPDGAILVDGAQVDRLQIFEFGGEPLLQRSGNTELIPDEGAPPPTIAEGTTVRQGAVESSNVDVTATFTTIIEIQRAYEANQRMIQNQDELIGRAVNDIARPAN